MNLTNAWLFPGQGSQYPSMGRSIWNHEAAKPVMAAAESISALPLCAVIANGPVHLLRSPEYLEPAVTALQIACVLLARRNGLEPDTVAGYSLGEIGALYSAGCLSVESALTLAAGRGKILARHCASGSWRSVSVSFAHDAPLPAIPSFDTVFTAAYNSASEFTITGEEDHIRQVEGSLIRAGASISPVSIDGPWHSPLAAISARETSDLLRNIEFSQPLLPVCLASIGRFESNLEVLQSCLARGIETPVLWAGTADALWQAGVRRTVEFAPGRVITSFLRNNWRGRNYSAHFLEREGGRPIDFEVVKRLQSDALSDQTGQENQWKKLA